MHQKIFLTQEREREEEDETGAARAEESEYSSRSIDHSCTTCNVSSIVLSTVTVIFVIQNQAKDVGKRKRERRGSRKGKKEERKRKERGEKKEEKEREGEQWQKMKT